METNEFMPRETQRSPFGSHGYQVEHSPGMLVLLDVAAQPTAYTAVRHRVIALEAYHCACAMIAERRLEGAIGWAITYWVGVRDQLAAKYKFTEKEINDG